MFCRCLASWSKNCATSQHERTCASLKLILLGCPSRELFESHITQRLSVAMYFITITPPTWTFIIKCNEMCNGAEHKNRYIWWWYILQKSIYDCAHVMECMHVYIMVQRVVERPGRRPGRIGCVSTLTSRDTALWSAVCLTFLHCAWTGRMAVSPH